MQPSRSNTTAFGSSLIMLRRPHRCNAERGPIAGAAAAGSSEEHAACATITNMSRPPAVKLSHRPFGQDDESDDELVRPWGYCSDED
eukprot:6501535-Prymnesium_polylepis.1